MPSAARSRPGPLLRLQASGVTRRLLPVRVGVALADARAARLWRRPSAREEATQAMQLLLGRTSRAAEVERLARAWLVELCRHEELAWHTDLICTRPVRSLERLREQVDRGRGAILSVVHLGHFGAHPGCVARHGFPLVATVAPTLLGEQPRTPAGLRRAQLFRTFDHDPRVTVVDASGSYERLRSVLRGGGTVLLGCDLRGSTPVRFLGRTVRVPSGTARLSLETGAPVVVLSAEPDGLLERVVVQEPLLPEHFPTVPELLQAVLDRHAPAVLAWPQAYERPRLHLDVVPEPALG